MTDTISLRDIALCVVDTETGGLKPTDRVYEVAVYRIDPDGERSMSTLVNPGNSEEISATEIHGITRSMLDNAPAFADIIPTLNDWMSGCLVLGHNVRFDLDFLHYEYNEAGVDFPSVPYACTKEGARSLLNIPKHRLGDCCEYFDIDISGWHAAEADTRATGALALRLLDIAEARGRGRVPSLPWFAQRTPLAELTVPELFVGR